MVEREAETVSIGMELERRRLAHRAARIRHALDAMRQLTSARAEHAPAPLRLGMTDFGRELQRVERRLRELDRAWPRATSQAVVRLGGGQLQAGAASAGA